jgi:hypothetical protein
MLSIEEMFNLAGRKVECVDTRFYYQVHEFADHLPKLGQIYTIREVVVANDWRGFPGFAIKLVEIKNPGEREINFSWHHFRLIDETTAHEAAKQEICEPEYQPL